jgi:purine-nucleoside phosphorylase
MTDLSVQVEDAVAAIQRVWNTAPRAGIVLGTGLGRFAREIDEQTVFPYHTLPHFPRSSVAGHAGQLVCGRIDGLPVVAMEGRFHRYEGYSLRQITLPIRVMRRLGIELLIVSNAAGGLNPHFRAGDIVVIDDHVNLMGDNPLIGPAEQALGPRFPDMSEPYCPRLVARAVEIARGEGFVAHRGVYVGLTGPSFETKAEYRFLRAIGGDLVGMSTVPEVIVAAQIGLRVLALSTVTNVCLPDRLGATAHEEVMAAAAAAEPRMGRIVRRILEDERNRPAG